MEWNTTSDILSDLLDFENKKAWSSLVERFHPIIVGHARQLGFQQADAEDVAQNALLRFANAYRKGAYDKSKGRLRSWLFTISSRVLADEFQASARRSDALGGRESDGDDLESEETRRDAFNRVWDREVLVLCLRKVKMEFSYQNYRAFCLLALEDRPAASVAEELGMTRRAVYLAKYRVLKRLSELNEEFERLD